MSQEHDTSLVLRTPVRTDGAAIHSLIQSCPPLDVNSLYVYLLLAEHFSATCVVAEDAKGQIDGFVSAYVPPGRDDVLFVWQVAVHERARGQRLARRMLDELLDRPALTGIRFIETTVGPDNAASRKTFSGLATGADTSITESSLFDASLFGGAAHEDERLLRIGPIAR